MKRIVLSLLLGMSPLLGAEEPPKPQNDIVDTVVATGRFNTFATALKNTGMVEVYKTAPFTLIAPSDIAFAKLAPARLDALMKDTERLKMLLRHHTAIRGLKADELAQKGTVKMADGTTAKFSISNDKLMINNVAASQQNIEASNGIIHMVDTLIFPLEKSPYAPVKK